jgi:anti-sigma regulatory factor (Ser/Thr protein kinase)
VLAALEASAQGPDGSDYVTAACVVIDPASGRLTYSGAGHPPGLVLFPDGGVKRLDEAQSPPLTGRLAGPRPEAGLVLPSGSLVVLYSDGLVERRGERLEDGIGRLVAMLGETSGRRPLRETADAILAGMTAGSVLDDVVVTCLQYSEPLDRLEFAVPADGGQLAGVRSRLRYWLQVHDVAERDQSAILLAVGEACSNAAEHAYRRARDRPDAGGEHRIEVHLSLHDTYVAVCVRDTGTWRHPGGREGPGGRGTSIMRTLAHHFDRRTGSTGTEVRMALPLSVAVGDGDD